MVAGSTHAPAIVVDRLAVDPGSVPGERGREATVVTIRRGRRGYLWIDIGRYREPGKVRIVNRWPAITADGGNIMLAAWRLVYRIVL